MAQLADWLEEHMPREDILASNHALPNLAPLSSITDIGNDDDHCFMELTSVDVSDDARGFNIIPESTPFSVIYHKTIETASPEGQLAIAAAEQENLLERIESDTREVLTSYGHVNQEALCASLTTIATQMAQKCGSKLVPASAQMVKEGEFIFPAHIDMELINTIIHSAMNHQKVRSDLVGTFGEARVAKLHTDFLQLLSRT